MIISLASLTSTAHAQSSGPSLRLIPSIAIANIDSPNTPIKQGGSFTTAVTIENTYSKPQDVEIRFDIENTGITKPDPDFITLTSGPNERKYNFETSQNVIPGNYVVNIQLWSSPNPDSFILEVLPELLDTSNFEIIIEEPIQVPQSPLDLDAKTISSSEIQLRWQKPQDNGGSDIIGYKIERKIDSNLFLSLVENTGNTKTSYSDTDLKSDTKYSYRVFAINSAGISEPSNEDSATTSKELIPRISRLNTDKSNYQTDGQNDIVVTVTGRIENPYKESTIVDVTLEKSNNPDISSIPQRLNLKDDGTFKTEFHLEPEKFTAGSYDVEATYEDQSKTIHFGIIKLKPPNFPPVITMPQDIIQTATDPKGAYISFDVTVTDEEDDIDSLNLDCNMKQGWFEIGNHQINCTVTDSGGKSDNGSFKITVNNALPISEIFVSSSDDSFEIEKPIFFSVKGSDPDGGIIEKYIWNFGDGNSTTTTYPEVSHSYNKEGTFDVSLDVIDDENSRSNQSSTVKISVNANYVWIIVVTLVCAIGGVGIVAAKYLLNPKSKLSTRQDMSTDNNPENDNDPKKQPPIDMDIEFRSGIEKK